MSPALAGRFSTIVPSWKPPAGLALIKYFHEINCTDLVLAPVHLSKGQNRMVYECDNLP